MNIDLSGRVVAVTGPGRGIGAVVARRFAEEGARMALFERDAETLERVGSQLEVLGGDLELFHCDVSNAEQVEDSVTRAIDRFGTIDVLINNAGVAPESTVEEMDVEEWDETFAVNVRGSFLTSRAVLPTMKRQRWGRVLNASSFAAIIPSYAFAAYAASKAAVTSMTRVLAGEVAPWHITVNSYAPGMVPTEMNRILEAPPERREQLLNTLAVREFGDPEDIASLLIFLSSDYARYITGTMIDISGGKFSTQFPQLAHQRADG
jgi:3-oxoacyl-[acyl-carrier protein] reductase